VTIDATGRVMRRDPASLDVLETVCRLDVESSSIDPSAPDFRRAAMGVTADTKSIALGMTNGTVEIWDLTSRTNVLLKAHAAPIRAVAFSPDSLSLVTVGQDQEVYLWDVPSLVKVESERLDEIPEGDVWPLCVRFSPRGDIVAVGSWKQLSIFDGSNLRQLRQFPTGRFVSLRFSPDGRYLASGHNGGHLNVWDTDDWSHRSLPGHDLVIFDVAFSPDGRRMVSGSNKLIVWDTDTWQQLAAYKLPLQDITFIKFSPDGNDLITSDAAALRLWRAASFKEIADREARVGRWP
jgi:WD40 repeat protein